MPTSKHFSIYLSADFTMRVVASSFFIGAATVAALPGYTQQGPGEQLVRGQLEEFLFQGPSGQRILAPSAGRVSQSQGEQVTEESSKHHACHEDIVESAPYGSTKWLQESLDALSVEERAIWDEVAMIYPEDMSSAMKPMPRKKHNRRPDDYWTHITSGAEVQSVWVESTKGGKEREVDGRLENYNLRTKKVDPSALGVDPDVKQYSGYLDDEEEDKHLFYCE